MRYKEEKRRKKETKIKLKNWLGCFVFFFSFGRASQLLLFFFFLFMHSFVSLKTGGKGEKNMWWKQTIKMYVRFIASVGICVFFFFHSFALFIQCSNFAYYISLDAMEIRATEWKFVDNENYPSVCAAAAVEWKMIFFSRSLVSSSHFAALLLSNIIDHKME